MHIRLAGFAGSLTRWSKTRALVDLVALRAAARFGATAATYDLGDLGAGLGQARCLGDLGPLPRAIIASMLSADALIVGCPAEAAGLAQPFRHLFDLIDPAVLAGKPVLLVAMDEGEAWAMNHSAKALLPGLRHAATVPRGVAATADDLGEGGPCAASLLTRIDAAVEHLAPWLNRAARAA